ncbi:uncharacterized protein LOC132726376 [Ruditapes philippinarum]|uniref:uncharacterized protein LOC132726376 n=1 Tax=Ruditapes philippinarum TaxID=129788 RepID=UPI00295B5ED9|nr:uncharacterized protein LOC132726376 [Ruditapes philippinarum]
MKKSCQYLENETLELKSQKENLNTKLVEIEMNQMRNNLMFYGIKEGGSDENCINLVKSIMTDKLKMDPEVVEGITIDRAYRMGRMTSSKSTRPIVAKFHYPKEKDKIRARSFEYAGDLNSVKLGIGAQLPKQLREARKPLYPAMKKAKDAGKHVRFVDFNEFSDHSPLSFTLVKKKECTSRIAESGIHPSEDKISWDEEKIPLFRSQLLDRNDDILKLTQEVIDQPIDHVVQNISQFISDNAFDVFGTKRILNHKHGKLSKKWFDKDCFEAKKEFKKARNVFNRHNTVDNRLHFIHTRTRYNKIKRSARHKFKIKEGLRINNLAKSQPRKFWQNIKNTYKDDKEKTDTLNVEQLYDHFKALFGEESQNENQNFLFNDNLIDEDLDAEINECELREAIFSQNNNKSPGYDKLTCEIFKAAYDIMSPLLLKLYNRLFINSEYPKVWGEGIITPVFKKGDVNDAKNYRGITLINILAKIYSQILLNRLSKWSIKHDKICSEQFGFQKGKSVSDCIFIFHAVISNVLNSGNKLYCIFVDYEKCFDKIDRSFLWQKLIAENISTRFVKAMKSMYTTVKSCVRYNSTYSDFFNSHIGLKQVVPRSPLFFVFFVNDKHCEKDMDIRKCTEFRISLIYV